MDVSFFIANRYFRAKKSHHLVQMISTVSLLSITVCTAALFIIMSVFNGLQDFISSHLNTFHADIEITPEYGKTFAFSKSDYAALQSIKGVEYVSEVINDLAVLSHQDRQLIVKLKGVYPDYYKMKHIDTTVYSGIFKLQYGEFPLAVLGAGVENNLHCGVSDFISNSIKVYYPFKDKKLSVANPMQGLKEEYLTPVGCFAADGDMNYVFTSINFMRNLTSCENEVTSVEVRTNPGMSVKQICKEISNLMGEAYCVKDSYQQESELYKVMKSEKWAIFAILSFILLIASFNLIGMMSVLVLDKKNDIGIFYAMGSDVSFIKKVFIKEGIQISLIGTILGLLIGLFFCFLQKTFHIIHFGDGNYVLSYYPVEIQFMDVVSIFFVVMLITIPAMWIPVTRISDKLFKHIR